MYSEFRSGNNQAGCKSITGSRCRITSDFMFNEYDLSSECSDTGIGTWTIVSGAGGSFVNANSPTTVFNGVSGTTYDLQWTISNGVCPSTSDNVKIQFKTPPTVATAGPDQTLCSTSAILAGNTPTTGTGQWTIVSGAGGSFALDTNPTTTFSGTAGTTYVLTLDDHQWCMYTEFRSGNNQTGCKSITSSRCRITSDLMCNDHDLSSERSDTGTGTWTIVSGAGGSFVNANSPTTVFNGVSGTTYDLQWTISNGVCPSTSDNVQIQFNDTTDCSHSRSRPDVVFNECNLSRKHTRPRAQDNGR